MIRTQIQITHEQARALKRLSAKTGQSVAELVRRSVDDLIRREGVVDQDELRRKAIQAAGKLRGPENFAADHDHYLTEALDQ